MQTIKIRKWSEYQHYKDGRRTPSWIKLHAKILTSSTWNLSSNDDRVLMIALMMLAAQNNNETPYSPEYIKRVAYLDELPNLDRLIALDFIRIEGEAGEVTELPKPAAKPKRKPKPKTAEHFETFWLIYPNKRNKKRACQIWENQGLDKINDVILADVKNRIQNDDQWTRDGGKYIPHASSYLNGERWQDAQAVEMPKRGDDLGTIPAGQRW